MALTDQALTTLAIMQSELGTTEETRLERRIEAASEAIAEHLGRTLHYRAAAVEDTEGRGGAQLLTKLAPLKSITSIKLIAQNGDEITEYAASTYSIEEADAGIIHRESGWPDTASEWSPLAGGNVSGSHRSAIRVTAVAGWVTQTQIDNGLTGASRDLPYAIEEACVLTVQSMWAGRGRDLSVKSEELGDASVTYFDGRQGDTIVPPSAKALLAPYRWAS